MLGTDGWYTGLVGKGSVDAVYNIADAINKIGFGLVIYTLAVKRTNKNNFYLFTEAELEIVRFFLEF
jgi:hypothetical protein